MGSRKAHLTWPFPLCLSFWYLYLDGCWGDVALSLICWATSPHPTLPYWFASFDLIGWCFFCFSSFLGCRQFRKQPVSAGKRVILWISSRLFWGSAFFWFVVVAVFCFMLLFGGQCLVFCFVFIYFLFCCSSVFVLSSSTLHFVFVLQGSCIFLQCRVSSSCLLVVLALTAYSWLFGICCWLSWNSSSFSSVVYVLGFGGVLDLGFGLLVALALTSYLLSWFFWALAIPSCNFLRGFGSWMVKATWGPRNSSHTHTSRCPHCCPKTGFQIFFGFSAEMVPLSIFVLLPKTRVLPWDHYRNFDFIQKRATFNNGPAMLYNIEAPFYTFQGGTSIGQVAATARNGNTKYGGDMGSGHASCLQVMAANGPSKYLYNRQESGPKMVPTAQ